MQKARTVTIVWKESSMHRFLIFSIAAVCFCVVGCGEGGNVDQKKVEKDPSAEGFELVLPGVEVKVNEKDGVSVKAPNTEVNVNDAGVEVDAPGAKVRVKPSGNTN